MEGIRINSTSDRGRGMGLSDAKAALQKKKAKKLIIKNSGNILFMNIFSFFLFSEKPSS